MAVTGFVIVFVTVLLKTGGHTSMNFPLHIKMYFTIYLSLLLNLRLSGFQKKYSQVAAPMRPGWTE